jgi:hypothetical protein
MELSTNRDLDIERHPDIKLINRDKELLGGFVGSPDEADLMMLHDKLKSYRAYSTIVLNLSC